MEDFLRKIKLIDEMSTKLNITSSEFVRELKVNVEESNIDSVFSGLFEGFSSNKKAYKGLVDSRGFYIRKKKRLFEKKRGSINAKGTFRTNADVLIINTTIRAFNVNRMIVMSLISICYITFIIYQFGNINPYSSFFENVPIFFILFFMAMPLILWFSLKKEVANMKKDLEKQFQSISRKINHSR